MAIVRYARVVWALPWPSYVVRVLQVEVRESLSPGDSMGRAVLVVQRVQGSQGPVGVQWRLNAEAQDDFVPPLEGSLQFAEVGNPCQSGLAAVC